MRREHFVRRVNSITILETIRYSYNELIASSPGISLRKLIAPEDLELEHFFEGFTPHPRSADLSKAAESFGNKYGTWLANSKYYIDCAFYLYPLADYDRLLTIVKNLSIGFYLNDVMGRDVFKFLSQSEREESVRMIRRMSEVDASLNIPANAHPLEIANIEILQEFKDNSPDHWFLQFLKVYCYHIGITHRDRNANALGHIPGITEYIHDRCYYAGVHHVIMWLEYCAGIFLEDLAGQGILSELKSLHGSIARLAALLNDLFSFEQEVIENGADSNLVMVLAMNYPGIDCKKAIEMSGEIVKEQFKKSIRRIASLNKQVALLDRQNPELTEKLQMYLTCVIRCVQAIWIWHADSKRYKRPHSIWNETQVPEKRMKDAS